MDNHSNWLIEQVASKQASELCKQIIEKLPDYFGVPESNKKYIEGVKSCINFVAVNVKDRLNIAGMLSLNFPYPENSSIYWMGINPGFHGQGAGTLLVQAASNYAKNHKVKYMIVETLAPFEADPNYLKTYQFYQKQEFVPLHNFKPAGYEFNMVCMLKDLKED